MAEKQTERVYEILIEQSRERGELESEEYPSNHRKHPRIRVNALSLSVDGEHDVDTIDLSVAGVSFYSETPFEAGIRIMLSPDEIFHTAAVVVDCQHAHDVEDVDDQLYRISCRFEDNESGVEFMLLTRDLES